MTPIEKAPLFTHNLTDLGNAERFVAQHKEEIKYCHPWGKWIVWNGKRWVVDDTAKVWRFAVSTVRKIYAEATVEEDPKVRVQIASHAKASEAASKIRAMLYLAEKLNGVPILPKELDTNPWLINVENGTLDLQTQEFWSHRREDYITQLAPVTYDKRATCPKWIAFLDKAMEGSQAMLGFLQRSAGYCLTGRVSEQKMFFAFGPSMSSKSTYFLTLQGMMGDYAITTTGELLLLRPTGQHTTDLADLRGKRMAVTIEIQQGRQMAESLVKSLTGGDKIRARRMRQDNEEWVPTHKIVLAANHKPIVKESTTAYWRRIDLIPFDHPIPKEERINDYYEVLLKERDGIFLWAIDGCKEWQKIGLKEPMEVVEATKVYRSEMDVLRQFLEDCCIIDPEAEITNKDLRADYVRWCEEGKEKPVYPNAFASNLEENGFIRGRNKSGSARIWKGVRLKAFPEEITLNKEKLEGGKV